MVSVTRARNDEVILVGRGARGEERNSRAHREKRRRRRNKVRGKGGGSNGLEEGA